MIVDRNTLDLNTVYSPIAAELERVRAAFRAELASDQPFIEQLADHVSQYHGKMLRPALVLLVGQACGGLQPAHITLGAVVEMVHIATLVHDDILDEADVRRRVPTINTLVGNERAVLLGDYLISHSYHLCSSLASQYAARRVAATTNRVCEGEMMQVAHRNDLDLDEATYFDIIERKTASLIGTCCELGAWAADAGDETAARLAQLGTSLGIAFQIVDDILDLTGDESVVGKSLGRDADKGKLTLPMIHFLAQADESAQAEFRSLLAKKAAMTARVSENGDHACGEHGSANGNSTNHRTPDQKNGHDSASRIDRDEHSIDATDSARDSLSSDVDLAIRDLLQDAGSFDYARDAAQQRIDAARTIALTLPDTPARTSLLAMTDFVLSRRH